MHDVDIAVCKSTIENNQNLQEITNCARDVKIINSEEELVASGVYKVHLLGEDVKYQCRALLSEKLETNAQKLPIELSIGRQFYAMKAYSYACMFEDSKKLNDYDEIQELYGKYIYAMTLKHSKGKVGLTWLDFIMHRPSGHLEMGVCAPIAGPRYKEFSCWEKGDTLTITIMADGFADVVLEVVLDEMPNAEMLNKNFRDVLENRAKQH